MTAAKPTQIEPAPRLCFPAAGSAERWTSECSWQRQQTLWLDCQRTLDERALKQGGLDGLEQRLQMVAADHDLPVAKPVHCLFD